MEPDKLYTVAETAKILKCNTHYIYSLIDAGLLTYLKLGRMKIRNDTINDFLRRWDGWDLSNPANPIKIEQSQKLA